MKNIIKIMLFMILITGIMIPQKTQAAISQEQANKMYAKALKSGIIRENLHNMIYSDGHSYGIDNNKIDIEFEKDNAYYMLYDLNGDGIQELVLACYSGSDPLIYHIWTIKDGKVSLYLEYVTDLWLELYYEKSKKIFWYNCDGGGSGTIKYKKSGKTLKELAQYDCTPGIENADKNNKIYQYVRTKCKSLLGETINLTKLYKILSGQLVEKKLNLVISKKKQIKLDNNISGVKWSVISGKEVVSLSNKNKHGAMVIGKKTGKAKITAKAGNTIFKFFINVTNNVKDVKALEKLISKHLYSKVSTNVNNKKQYIWSKKGRLKAIRWNDKNLKGKISFNEFNTLTEISCKSNKLTSISIDKLISLRKLDCGYNNLKKLELGNNIKLRGLQCDNNNIKKLDLSRNIALFILSCNNNNLKYLDLSKNEVLYLAECNNNKIETLELGNNTILHKLDCGNNKLKTIDVSKNTAIYYLECYNNSIEMLDLNKNKELYLLNCRNNNIKELDLNQNINLSVLLCESNQLKKLDLKQNMSLTRVMCEENQLELLDISNCSGLIFLYCGENQLELLDVSNNITLQALSCDNNILKILDLSHNINLEMLSCTGNIVTTLDLSNNTGLKSLTCDDDTEVSGVEDSVYDGYYEDNEFGDVIDESYSEAIWYFDTGY